MVNGVCILVTLAALVLEPSNFGSYNETVCVVFGRDSDMLISMRSRSLKLYYRRGFRLLGSDENEVVDCNWG